MKRIAAIVILGACGGGKGGGLAVPGTTPVVELTATQQRQLCEQAAASASERVVECSDGSTVIISSNSQGGVSGIGGPQLSTPRFQHTCTALPDGTVLVPGGLNQQANGMKEILQDAWIYQPIPTDD